MTITASPPPQPHQVSTIARKGLKIGAIGLFSSIIIGVASTAPGYSLAATLGYIAKETGAQSPIVIAIAFVPMLFISYAYQALNERTPDCGTSFTWVARTFGRRSGWITGWVIIVADIIVMANLAQIAGQYTLNMVGIHDSLILETTIGCIWIVGMTVIAWLGIEMSARTQAVLLGIELVVLLAFSLVALTMVYTGHAGSQALHPDISWFNPWADGMTPSAFSAGFLLAVFIYWGWDSAVSTNEETTTPTITPGRAAVASTVVLLATYLLVTVSAQAYAGIGTSGIGLTNPATLDDPLSGIGKAVLGEWGAKALFLAILTSAAASTQTTILPTARTTLAMAVYRALPPCFGHIHQKYKTPSVSTWMMGIVSVFFYAAITWVNERALGDLIASVGLLIAFYYGLTGFAAAWEFRSDIRSGVFHAFRRVIFPFTGGVILFAAFALTAIDSFAQDFGQTVLCGVGGVFLLGIGSILLGVIIMIVYSAVHPAYFRGDTMVTHTVVTEAGDVVPADHLDPPV